MLAFSAGLTAASPDMEDTLDKYLDDTKTYDISILATLGLTDEDITKLEELEQIEKAYGVQNKDYIIEMAGKEYVAQIIEYNENVNTPYLVQGRMPENNTECLIEKEFLEYNKYNIGDKINFLELNYDFYIVAKEAYERETNYINEQVLLNLTKDFDTHIYKVTLNDWSIVNKTIKDINFNSNSNQGLNIIIYNSDGGIYNYGEYILIYSLLIIILFGASLLILIYIIKVTFDKEQEKRYLYYCLGFNKGQLNRLILTKIFLILGIGTALFWLIFGVVSLII